MYRPIPADWLSPWGDKQEGQLYWRPMKWKAVWFILNLLSIAAPKKKGESKIELLLQLEIWEIAFAGGGEQWILLLESYTITVTLTKVASGHDAHSQQVGCRKRRRLPCGSPWRFRPSFMKIARRMRAEQSEGGRYHCIKTGLYLTSAGHIRSCGRLHKRTPNTSDSQHTEPET